MNACKEINVEQAEKLRHTLQTVVFDLRDRTSFRCGHIPNAINVVDTNMKMLLENLNKSLPILCYGETESDSGELCELLHDFGFDQCYSLRGGYDTWETLVREKSPLRADLSAWMQALGFSTTDLNSRGYNGETALMRAAREGKTEYVIEMIEHGADIECRNNDGNTAVWMACHGGNPFVLQVLIEAGADINAQNDNGATALTYTASAGLEKMVKLLVSAGADLELATLDGFSALDVAATLPILRFLNNARKGEVNLDLNTVYLQAV